MGTVAYEPPNWYSPLDEAVTVKEFPDGSKLVDTKCGQRLRVWPAEEPSIIEG